MTKNKISFKNKSPFFIDVKGRAIFRSQAGQKLNWSDFAKISGLGKVATMTFRHNMCAILMSQSSIAMAEMEEYVACHSKATQKRNYADEVALKAKNLKAQDWYTNHVAPAEYNKMQDWFAKDSASHRAMMEMHEQHLEEMEQQTVLEMMEADQKDEDLLPQWSKDNKLLLLGDRQKIALLDATIEAGTGNGDRGIDGLSGTIFDDLLAKGTRVKNKWSAKIVLRLLTMSDQELGSRRY